MTVESSALIDKLCYICRALPEGDGPGIRADIRAIGQRLHEIGGHDLMEDAFLEVMVINHHVDAILPELWLGIGEWRS